MPLANISPDPGDEYFADGMTEELIHALSRVSGLSVIARTTAMRYKGADRSVAEIGRELNIQTALEGSVRKAKDKVRITVQLVDTATEDHIWSQVYDRDLEDIFAIQSDIARRVARALRIQIARREERALERRATKVVESYTLYLKGRYHWNRRSEEGFKSAISYFEQALKKDPSYALAYSGLADAYALLAWFEMMPPHEAFPRAQAAAEEALRLDGQLAEAYASLGFVKFQYGWDWEGAEAAFHQALELDPGYPTAHQFYADYLKAMGRFEEALTEMAHALELDPFSLPVHTGLGHVLYLARQYDRAITQYQKALEMDPNFLQAHLWFGRPYLEKGMYKEAVEEVEQAVKLSKGATMPLAVLGHVYAAAGQEEKARRILKDLMVRAEERYLPSYWIALIYAGMEDRDRAFEWLERAHEEHSAWLVWMEVEPRFDVLREDPRFARLVREMGLEGATDSATAPVVNTEEREAIELLSRMEALRLSRYRVVGNYYRFEAATRNRLKDLKQKILAGLENVTPGNENYLLWAPPGAGKTFFVQQVRGSVGEEVAYEEISLAKVDEPAFRSWIAEVKERSEPCLVFVDEVDSQARETWPYEALLGALESAAERGVPRVFVLAGSSGLDVSGMEEDIAARPKGKDLLSRIPSENVASVPPMTAGDRLLVTSAVFTQTAAPAHTPISEIEKLALYYVLLNPHLNSARQIREFARRGAERAPRGEDRIRYDHLFNPGDARNKEFWAKARASAPELINAFVAIEG